MANNKEYYKGEGGGFPIVRVMVNLVSLCLFVFVRGSFVHQKCSNYVLVVFTFRLIVESIKEFEGASKVVCNFQIVDYNACYNKCSSLKEMQVAMNFQVQIK